MKYKVCPSSTMSSSKCFFFVIFELAYWFARESSRLELTLTPSPCLCCPQAAVSISQGNNHRLQFVINDHVLPYNMTVFQAIQQFSQETADSDSELTVGSTHLFQRTHTIYYRSVAGTGIATVRGRDGDSDRTGPGLG